MTQPRARGPVRHLQIFAVIVSCLWVVASSASGQNPPGASHPCKMSVAQGFIEFRRAQFQQAMSRFEEALGGTEQCVVEARLGKAVTYNGLNDHKKAVAEAQWVLQATDDPELLSEAHYQIGRGLHKRGTRMTQQKAAAETAFQQAVEISNGDHRGAIRGLSRIYLETQRDDELAALQKRFPDLHLSNRASKARLRPESSKKTVSLDCEVETDAEWNQAVPRFWDETGAESKGYVAPVRTLDPQPKLTKKARRLKIAGNVTYQALVDTVGVVVKAKILESPNPTVDLSVLEAVCRQAYVPARDPEGEASVAFIRGAHQLVPE